MNSEIETAVKAHFEKVKAMREAHHLKLFDSEIIRERENKIKLIEGKKYFKIVVGEGSAFSFICKETGYIFKPASWSKPAKQPRGCVVDASNGLNCVSVYGVNYLR
jgi:hypothetical protein